MDLLTTLQPASNILLAGAAVVAAAWIVVTWTFRELIVLRSSLACTIAHDANRSKRQIAQDRKTIMGNDDCTVVVAQTFAQRILNLLGRWLEAYGHPFREDA